MLQTYFSVKHKHRGYPVVDEKNRLLGVITISDMLQETSQPSTEPKKAKELIKGMPIVAYAKETCREAAERMATAGVGRLPVFAAEHSNAVVGMITRSDLLKPRLLHHSEERKYERFIGVKVRS